MARFNLEDYEPVEVRLARFKDEWPDSRIDANLVLEACSPTRFVVKAEVYRLADDAHPIATGLAYEDISDRGVNQTSALENCETSAIGRALANAGYAPKGKRPSREEMKKANAQSMTPAEVESRVAEAVVAASMCESVNDLRKVRGSFTAVLSERLATGETVDDMFLARKRELDGAA